MLENENRTRRELDAALRELLKQKSLEHIRVRELTERCGLRRQSFYYHFKDVYDLFAWSLQQERALLLEWQKECLTWQQALLELLDRISGNRTFYRTVLDYGGQKSLGELVPVGQTLAMVQNYYQERCGTPLYNGEQERRCAEVILLSLLEAWIRGGLALEPEEIAASLERTLERSTAGTIWQTLRERGDWPF